MPSQGETNGFESTRWPVFDPGALATGAGDGASDVAKSVVVGAAGTVGDAIDRARAALISLVRGKLSGHDYATEDLNVHVRRPSPETTAALAPHIIAAGIDRDPAVIAAAKDVIESVGAAAFGPGSVASSVINSVNHGSGHSHVGGQQNFGGTAHDPR